MPSSSPLRAAYVLVLLFALVAIGWLALLVLRQAIRAGAAEGWMMAGILAVVVGLPIAMLLLPASDWATRRRRRPVSAIVPNAGVNVPRAGQ